MLKRIFVFVLVVISIITLTACSQIMDNFISANYDEKTGELYVKNLSEKKPYDDVALTVEYYYEDNSKKVVTYDVGRLDPCEEKVIVTDENLEETQKKAYISQIVYTDMIMNRNTLIWLGTVIIVPPIIVVGVGNYLYKKKGRT